MAGEALLSLFCRPLAEGKLNPSRNEWTVETALTKARRVFPRFPERIQGKVVLDFGSGYGFQAVAMALAGAKHVYALDTSEAANDAARRLVAEHGLQDRITVTADAASLREGADAVLSQNSFEHFPDPGGTLKIMSDLLAPGGELLICFGPPWYAPYGSHMSYFCRLPWVNVLFPESTVMNVRARYRDDGARRYTEISSGLNMMSIAKWEGLVSQSGLRVEYSKYHAVKDIEPLAGLPVLRELFINDVTAILAKDVTATVAKAR